MANKPAYHGSQPTKYHAAGQLQRFAEYKPYRWRVLPDDTGTEAHLLGRELSEQISWAKQGTWFGGLALIFSI